MKRINLLPKDLQPHRKEATALVARLARTVRFSRGMLGVVGLVGVLGAGALWQGTVLWRYRYGMGQLRQELKSAQGIKVQLETQEQALHVQTAALAAQREALDQRRQVLVHVRQPAVPVSAVLVDLARTIPEEILVTKLTLAEETLKIVGTSHDTQSVTALIDRLEDSRRFHGTQFTRTERAPQTAEAPFSFEVSTHPVFQGNGVS